MIRATKIGRAGAILLLIGPLVSWIAEFITASAWQSPHYAPLYNWVSDLGVPGPRQVAFGQVIHSPLAWIMDSGWIFYGVVLIVGAFLALDLRAGARPIILALLAVLSGVGVSLVGIFHGSQENVANGVIVFHLAGAQTVIIAGNLSAVMVGVFGRRIGLGRGTSIASLIVGIAGLIGFVVFMTDYLTGIAWNIGLFERSAIYPIMIGHVLLANGLLRRMSSQPDGSRSDVRLRPRAV